MMSTCLFLLDRESGRFVALETRDQSLYRRHGFEAARRLGLTHPGSGDAPTRRRRADREDGTPPAVTSSG